MCGIIISTIELNDKKNTAEQIFKAIQKVSKENEISSWHILFPEEDEKDIF